VLGYLYPEHEAFSRLQKHIYKIWKDADDKENVIFRMNSCIKCCFQVFLENIMKLIKDSWMYAAAEKNLPLLFQVGR
jgi:deoxyhypusine synthase